MTNTNIHGTLPAGQAQSNTIEEQQTLVATNTAKYLEMCNKSLQAITAALAELKSKP
ncbi:MAG: hypothetical protein M1511_18425 [Deltaproteobacteria bacterium]|nr:hypothetical protein [Deltaproteobacteria bacterium]